APILDGQLNDPYWQSIPAHRLEPDQTGLTMDGGEIRAVVRGRYLLLAARLPEPTGRITARMTGRHPNWEDEDMLQITEGPAIGYTDRVVRINPFGAFTTQREGQEVYPNDHLYLIATHIGDREWTLEAAFPLNLTSAPDADTMLLSVQRLRAMRPASPQLRWRWPKSDPVTRVAVDRNATWDTPAPEHRPEPLGNTGPALNVGKASIPPASAAWDDDHWRSVPTWQLPANQPNSPPPTYSTQVKAIHDGTTLAVFFRAEDPTTPISRVKEADGRVEQDDSVHLYFATSGSSYVQISVNAAGYLLDVAGKTGGPRISRPRADWQSDAKITTRLEKGHWTARIDIPLANVLNILGEPETQTDLRVLLARARPGRDGQLSETSALPYMPGWTMLGPIRYQPLKLTATPPSQLPATPIPAPIPTLDTRVYTDAERATRKPAGMVHENLRARAIAELEKQAKAWANVNTREQWEQFRNTRIDALRRFLGPFPQRTALNTQTGKEYLGQGYRRQDIVYQSRPGLWIAANLYLPEKRVGRIPAIIIVPSHHRPRWQMELQDMGILWARSGSAVLIADNLSHGERIQTYPWNREGYYSRYNLGLQLYAAGESLIKWMVWDIMRSVDLLESRPEVDPSKIVLLGAVAGGGDPAAVAAAMEPRIAAVAPFCYAEATPEHGGRGPWPEGLADPGWGSWESTRNLPRSIIDQFSPWIIAASVAPRRFIYSFEMGWDVEKQPAWHRFQKIFGFYNATQNLDEAHGFGGFPGPGECANIGPSQRKTLYPELERWFNIPQPKAEPEDRRPEQELFAYNPKLAAVAANQPVHELAKQIALQKLPKSTPTRQSLQQAWSQRLGDVSPALVGQASKPARDLQVSLLLQSEPNIDLPVILLKPPTPKPTSHPAVLLLSHAGKAAAYRQNHQAIQTLLTQNIAVVLADVRGTGETSPDLRRGPNSTEISQSATELMLGSSLLGRRVKDVRTVLAYLRTRPDIDSTRIALWGDSSAPLNPTHLRLDESPGWQIGPDPQHEADPLGGLLAIFTALYEPDIRAIATRRTLASYLSLYDAPFAYLPAHVVVPDLLAAGDIPDILKTLNIPIRIEEPINARNQLINAPQPQGSLAEWLANQLKSPSR
ncbi:MAG: acetylxylan esterase, partial [Bryobacterales bacterium]|nr:acetylxylan esterase [Bryobacterales bacterium]